jgi:hypothetical protein
VSAILPTVDSLKNRELQTANSPLYGENVGMGGPRRKFIGQIPLTASRFCRCLKDLLLYMVSIPTSVNDMEARYRQRPSELMYMPLLGCRC